MSTVSKLLNEQHALLESEIATTVEILDALAGFIANTSYPSEQEFDSFTRPIIERHPEFWALHWVPKVTHAQRPVFEYQLKNRGFDKGITELEPSTNTISPSPTKNIYYPVQLTAPLDRNRIIVGFDANSRQINRDVINRALSQDRNFLSSEPFKLVQDNEGSASVIFFRPVFNTIDSPSDAINRKQHNRGFIVALVKPQTVLDLISHQDKRIATQLYDISGNEIINIGGVGQKQIRSDWLEQQVSFSSLGREWQLKLSISKEHPLLKNNSNRAIWVLLGGLAFTFALSGMLFRLSQTHDLVTRERDRAQSYLDTVGTMMMALDKRGRITMINRKGCEILGYSENELINSFWFSALYLVDHEKNYLNFLQNMQSGDLENESGQTETLVLDKAGNQLLIAWQNRLQFDAQGMPSGILSSGEDITEKHYIASLNRIRSKAMQTLLEGLSLERILENVLLGIEQINPGAKCSILLLDETGNHLLGCAAPSLPDAYNEAIDGVEIGDGIGSCGTAAFRRERVIVEDIQSHPYWVAFKELAAEHELGSCWSEPIFGKKGRLLGTFAIYHTNPSTPIDRDLTLISGTADFVSLLIEEQQAEANLKRLATTDELTTLPNRRQFLSTLEEELARAKRYSRQLSLCMLDLDHFKRINDQYGHNAGDTVLKEIASILGSVLRETDMAGRLGGEEFGILLPDTQESAAMIMAERLRATIEKKIVRHHDNSLHVTASIGVTSLELNSEISRGSELLSEADRCLYYAKHNGRNQISNTPTALNKGV